jgi:hypothetical protein
MCPVAERQTPHETRKDRLFAHARLASLASPNDVGKAVVLVGERLRGSKQLLRLPRLGRAADAPLRSDRVGWQPVLDRAELIRR